MSATQHPPARIRIVTHPPLDPLRAWLPLPTAADGLVTIQRLLEDVRNLLTGRPSLSAELQGFALLPSSPLSVLDPINDILDIHASTKAPVAARSAAQIALPASPPPASTPQRSSSGSPPAVLSSKRPLPNGKAPEIAAVRPSKRARRDSVSSTASSSGASSPSSSSSSSSSSRDSSSSSDSSDSEDSTDESSDASSDEAESAPTRAAQDDERVPVPPGSGQRRTKKRNLRKRTLRKARARDARAAAANSVPPAASTSKIPDAPTPPVLEKSAAPVVTASLKQSQSFKARDPYGGFDSTPSKQRNGSQKEALLRRPSTPVETGSKPGKSKIGAGGGRKTVAADSLFYRAPQPAELGSRPVMPTPRKAPSPSYRPTSPNVSYQAEPRPAAPDMIALIENEIQKAPTPSSPAPNGTRAPLFVQPSKRRDLPKHVLVTKVNVEAKNWQPGVGHRVEGTSGAYSETLAPKEHAVQAYGMPQRTAQGPVVSQQVAPESLAPKPVAPKRDAPKQVELEQPTPVANRPRTAASTALDADAVSARWDSLPSAEKGSAKRGDLIAIKLLELDPVTFMPTVSLKYGTLLAPAQVHSLRIELHPLCRAALDAAAEAAYQAEEEEAQYMMDDDEFYGQYKEKPKFGQDLLEEQEQEDSTIWEGDWEGLDVRSLAA